MPELSHFYPLIQQAKAVATKWQLSESAEAGGVAAAIESESGNIYIGVCLDMASGIGFCAEHSAGAAMVTAGENVIRRVVAVNQAGVILPPCGRCREFMLQLSSENIRAEVLVSSNQVVTLGELMPHIWWNALS